MRFIITFLFAFMCIQAHAEKCYIFIDKIGYVIKGQEQGMTAYGDVVAVTPYTSQYKPTEAELARYYVMVVDLEEIEVEALIEPEFNGEETTKARARKIDIGNMISIKQEDEVDKKTFTNNLSVKPIAVTP